MKEHGSHGAGERPARGDRIVSRIETEAMTLLLKRQQALRRCQAEARVAEVGTLVADEEIAADPPGEKVRRELADIEAALARIAEGRYGTCLACGGPLGLQRLRAIPEARYCLGCSGHRAAGD